jgi:hypothetical protein
MLHFLMHQVPAWCSSGLRTLVDTALSHFSLFTFTPSCNQLASLKQSLFVHPHMDEFELRALADQALGQQLSMCFPLLVDSMELMLSELKTAALALVHPAAMVATCQSALQLDTPPNPSWADLIQHHQQQQHSDSSAVSALLHRRAQRDLILRGCLNRIIRIWYA